MPLPLAVSCFSKIRIGFTFLVPALPSSSGQRAIKRVCVFLRVCVLYCDRRRTFVWYAGDVLVSHTEFCVTRRSVVFDFHTLGKNFGQVLIIITVNLLILENYAVPSTCRPTPALAHPDLNPDLDLDLLILGSVQACLPCTISLLTYGADSSKCFPFRAKTNRQSHGGK